MHSGLKEMISAENGYPGEIQILMGDGGAADQGGAGTGERAYCLVWIREEIKLLSVRNGNIQLKGE